MGAKVFVSRTLFLMGPGMIFDQIKKQAIAAVPFASYLDIAAVEVGRGTSVARLASRPYVYNHVGTVHAGAQFALGEAASGMAMAGAIAPLILAARPVASDANIAYSRPATGNLTALGQVRENIDELVGTLERDKKVRLTVDVEIKDEQAAVVSKMTVQWHVRIS